MNVSTKELRKQPGRILKKVESGQQVVITYRGKKMAKFIPMGKHVEPNYLPDGKDE